MRRAWCELDESTAAKRSKGQAADRGDSVDQAGAPRRPRRVHVDQRGSESGERRAGRYALYKASYEKERCVTSDHEQDEGKGFQRNRCCKHGAATNVIGKTAQNQQRSNQAEDVAREDDRQGRVGETPRPLVDDIQRRRRTRSRGEQHEDSSGRGECERKWQAARHPIAAFGDLIRQCHL